MKAPDPLPVVHCERCSRERVATYVVATPEDLFYACDECAATETPRVPIAKWWHEVVYDERFGP